MREHIKVLEHMQILFRLLCISTMDHELCSFSKPLGACYLAGLVDCVGTLSIVKRTGKSSIYYVQVTITLQSREFLEHINNQFGKNGVLWSNPHGSMVRNLHRLVFSSFGTRQILKIIKDHSIVYFKQASLALEFIDTVAESQDSFQINPVDTDNFNSHRVCLDVATMCKLDSIVDRFKAVKPYSTIESSLPPKMNAEYLAGVFDSKVTVSKEKHRRSVYQLTISLRKQPALLYAIASFANLGTVFPGSQWKITSRGDICSLWQIINSFLILKRQLVMSAVSQMCKSDVKGSPIVVFIQPTVPTLPHENCIC